MLGHSKPEKAFRKLVLWGVYASVALLLVSPALLCLWLVSTDWTKEEPRVVEDPSGTFSEYTGIPWPESAKIVLVGDSHGGWRGKGEFYLVFDVDPEILSHWLLAMPPWGGKEWQTGGVPYEIAQHCRFESQRFGLSLHATSLTATTIKYCALDRRPERDPWHHGIILAVNPDSGRVYLSRWDY